MHKLNIKGGQKELTNPIIFMRTPPTIASEGIMYSGRPLSVCPLSVNTYFAWRYISVLLVQKFQWNVSQIFIMWVGIAEKVLKVRGQSSMSYVWHMTMSYVWRIWCHVCDVYDLQGAAAPCKWSSRTPTRNLLSYLQRKNTISDAEEVAMSHILTTDNISGANDAYVMHYY